MRHRCSQKDGSSHHQWKRAKARDTGVCDFHKFFDRIERLVIGKRNYACSHGKHGRILEARLPHSGAVWDKNLDSECPTHQIRAGTQNRQERQQVDMQTVVGGFIKAELHTSERAERIAGFNALSKKNGAKQVSSEKNRIVRILEDCNVKLSSVLSDTSGVVATKRINILCEGKRVTMQEIDQACHKKLQCTKEDLYEACNGTFDPEVCLSIYLTTMWHIKNLAQII